MTTNIYKRKLIRNNIQYFIRQTISINKTQNLTPFLKLYKGMKVIIIENLYPKLGIVNRTIDYIQNILVNKSQWIQQDPSPANVYVDLNEFIEKLDTLQNIRLSNCGEKLLQNKKNSSPNDEIL